MVAVTETALTTAMEELAAQLGADHPLHADRDALRRFLVARKLHVGAAAEMIGAHLAFRASRLPVRLTPGVLAELRKGKFFLRGEDVDGRPLVVVRSGHFDPAERDLDAAVGAALYLVEETLGALAASGREPRFTMFYDRTGFSLRRNFDLPLLRAIITLLTENYPETLERALLYPCGLVLAGVWKVVGPLLDPRTRAKVRMLTSDAELHKYVPRAALPVAYGGELRPEDEFDAARYDGLEARLEGT
jgi:hypothetical protein